MFNSLDSQNQLHAKIIFLIYRKFIKDEKRILAAVEQQRADQIRRQAAAKLIQASWRQYHFNKNFIVEADKFDYRASKITNFFSKKKTLPGRRSGFHEL